MNSKRQSQSTIDSHFKRTVKLRSGEIIECMPSKVVDAAPLFACEYPGCSKQCANKGALTNHVQFAHPRRMGNVTRYLVNKPIKPSSVINSVVPFTMAMHLVSCVSNLVAVPFIRPVFQPFIPVEPEVKLDRRKFNRGEDHRETKISAYTFKFKAKCMDDFLEAGTG